MPGTFETPSQKWPEAHSVSTPEDPLGPSEGNPEFQSLRDLDNPLLFDSPERISLSL